MRHENPSAALKKNKPCSSAKARVGSEVCVNQSWERQDRRRFLRTSVAADRAVPMLPAPACAPS